MGDYCLHFSINETVRSKVHFWCIVLRNLYFFFCHHRNRTEKSLKLQGDFPIMHLSSCHAYHLNKYSIMWASQTDCFCALNFLFTSFPVNYHQFSWSLAFSKSTSFLGQKSWCPAHFGAIITLFLSWTAPLEMMEHSRNGVICPAQRNLLFLAQ